MVDQTRLIGGEVSVDQDQDAASGARRQQRGLERRSSRDGNSRFSESTSKESSSLPRQQQQQQQQSPPSLLPPMPLSMPLLDASTSSERNRSSGNGGEWREEFKYKS